MKNSKPFYFPAPYSQLLPLPHSCPVQPLKYIERQINKRKLTINIIPRPPTQHSIPLFLEKRHQALYMPRYQLHDRLVRILHIESNLAIRAHTARIEKPGFAALKPDVSPFT